ncbi:MAG TPA: VanZ family protein [Oleiagrimonas sp.]|nr:VanZ family protein [Oleiagrimonas sp.]
MTRPSPALRRVLVRAAFIAVLAVVLYAGLRQQAVPETFDNEDKLYHLLGFAALAVCTRLAFPRWRWWWQVLGALAIGGGIELFQNLQPARVGSWWDFLADAIGVGLGWLLLQLPPLRR